MPFYNVGAAAVQSSFGQKNLMRASDGTLWNFVYRGLQQFALYYSNDEGVTWAWDGIEWGEHVHFGPSTWSAAIDSFDTIHMIWDQDTGGGVDDGTRYRSRLSDGTYTAIQTTSLGIVHDRCVAIVDGNDRVFIKYYVYYREIIGGVIGPQLDQSLIPHGALCFDYQGHMHGVRMGTVGPNYNIYHSYNTGYGTATNTETIFTSTDQQFATPKIVCDSSNNLYVAWVGLGHLPYPLRRQLVYMYKPFGGAWEGPTVVTQQDANIYFAVISTSIVLGITSNDWVYFVWTYDKANYELYYRIKANAWHDEELLISDPAMCYASDPLFSVYPIIGGVSTNIPGNTGKDETMMFTGGIPALPGTDFYTGFIIYPPVLRINKAHALSREEL